MGNDINNAAVLRLILSLVFKRPTPPKHRNPIAEEESTPTLKAVTKCSLLFFICTSLSLLSKAVGIALGFLVVHCVRVMTSAVLR